MANDSEKSSQKSVRGVLWIGAVGLSLFTIYAFFSSVMWANKPLGVGERLYSMISRALVMTAWVALALLWNRLRNIVVNYSNLVIGILLIVCLWVTWWTVGSLLSPQRPQLRWTELTYVLCSGLAYGLVSGLFASCCKTPVVALVVSMVVFIVQVTADSFIGAAGLYGSFQLMN
ncbi:MAG: hypothetical protein KGL00_09175 [Gammaproteobacteria bacterium]|nr:hypothetical protein [Gammaproteobacteria bacterium]MDE1886726.1 hypothetical protein [Gammaproteobacteria bacterium]MDE2022697.1 hypothetical protein [Gammaproteobacteria bacterium]MDE2274354.1 hypothetical protein [Gammaproteobacteria bacterium]